MAFATSLRIGAAGWCVPFDRCSRKEQRKECKVFAFVREWRSQAIRLAENWGCFRPVSSSSCTVRNFGVRYTPRNKITMPPAGVHFCAPGDNAIKWLSLSKRGAALCGALNRRRRCDASWENSFDVFVFCSGGEWNSRPCPVEAQLCPMASLITDVSSGIKSQSSRRNTDPREQNVSESIAPV